MVRPVVILVLVLITLVCIAAPIGLYFTKEQLSCYPVFDGTESCYADTIDSAYRGYGPKTDYTVSTGLKDDNVSQLVIKGCEPVMLYMFSRHSARYPDLGDLQKMSRVLREIRDWVMQAAEEGKVHLCSQDLQDLHNWEPLYHETDAAQAMATGNEDIHHIARRFKGRFPTLFPSTYSQDDYKFGYSNRERTNQSLWAYTDILFNETEKENIVYPKKDVKLVSFHKNCERKLWPNRTKPSRELFDEPEAFRVGPVAERFVYNVKQRLGLERRNLSYTDLRQIAVECAVSFTAYGASPWCGVLSEDDMKVMEFDDDIYDFYKDAYGRPLNPKMGCPVVNEIVRLFGDVAANPEKSHLKSVLYFGHSRDFKKLLGSFGLFKGDDLLKADEYCHSKVQNRIWRDAVFSPYSANIAFVLFNCAGKYRVMTLVNEKPTRLVRCSDGKGDMLCDLDDFIEGYQVANCNIKKICVPAAISEQWPDSHWEDESV